MDEAEWRLCPLYPGAVRILRRLAKGKTRRRDYDPFDIACLVGRHVVAVSEDEKNFVLTETGREVLAFFEANPHLTK